MHDPAPMPDPTRRFSDRVEYYVRSRPRYPREILDFCRSELRLAPADQVADVGSGTGFLSELFLQNGNPVFAVEPNDAMRLAAEKSLGRIPNFHSVKGTAEQTGLPGGGFGFVVAGQAFHWFDRARARLEFQRLLRPDGWVLLVWNDREKVAATDSFSAAYDAMVREFQIDWHKVRHESITAQDSGVLAAFFAPGGYQHKTFANPQSLDLDGLLARALSSSYLPLPGQPRCDPMLDRLREIYRRHAKDGHVVQPYNTQVYYGRLS
jgi:SAM-dependent methyltransferase